MITIKDQDFEMEQVKDLPFFDLKMPAVINAGKENERVDMKLLAYGIPFHACIKEIVAHRLHTPDKTYSVSEYLSAYGKEVEKIVSLITFTEKPSKKKDEEEIEEEMTDEDS